MQDLYNNKLQKTFKRERDCKPSAAEQVIGREGETATFLSRCTITFGLRVVGFAPRQLNRWVAICFQSSPQNTEEGVNYRVASNSNYEPSKTSNVAYFFNCTDISRCADFVIHRVL